MKKPKAARRRLREAKYQEKLIKSATFSDMVKASVEAARKKEKKKKKGE